MLAMSRRNRQRSITVLLLIASLLFQQFAMASYACTMSGVPTTTMTMVEDCPTMASNSGHVPDAFCQKHCAPDATSPMTYAVPAVPALGLPPVSFMLTVSDGLGQSGFLSDVAIARAHPPPRVRYCRLLI
ncbi:MAG: hypothetical protein WAV67_10555 [Dokdonella sp.]